LRFVAQGWPYSEMQPRCPCPGEELNVSDPSFATRRYSSIRSLLGFRRHMQRLGSRLRPTTVRIVPNPDDEDSPAEALLHQLDCVLQQGARKPFEPTCELLQIKMSVVMVSFFVAVMPFGPVGVFLTLVAKWIEVKAMLSKIVLIRRRVFAGSDRAMRQIHQAFIVALSAALPAWTITLSSITYNAELYSWVASSSGISPYVWNEEPKYFVYRLCIMWLILCAVLFMSSGGDLLSRRRVFLLLVVLPTCYFAFNPEAQVGRRPGV